MLVPVELGLEVIRLHAARGLPRASEALLATADGVEVPEVVKERSGGVIRAVGILDFLKEPLPGGRTHQDIDATLSADRDAWDK